MEDIEIAIGQNRELVEGLLINDENQDLNNSTHNSNMYENEFLMNNQIKENEDTGAIAVDIEVGGEQCTSCYSNYDPKDFFALNCGHKFCINCIRENLQIRIESGNAMQLPCMENKCPENYTLDHIKRFCS